MYYKIGGRTARPLRTVSWEPYRMAVSLLPLAAALVAMAHPVPRVASSLAIAPVVADSGRPKRDTTKTDSSAIYICPMDAEVVRHEPGNCPLCGMKLVKKTVKADSTTKSGPAKKPASE
jgi:hypothetical protein